jgi:hypothetical protein
VLSVYCTDFDGIEKNTKALQFVFRVISYRTVNISIDVVSS